MSIEQKKIIDIISTDKNTGKVYLTITDHLSWDNPKDDHLFVLQDKINDYLAFIEGGELLQAYPKAKDRKVVIQIVGKYPLSEEARHFYEHAGEIVANAGFELQFELSQDK